MVTFLDRWIGFADRLSVIAVRIAGALVFAAAILVSVDVLIRKFFGISFGDAMELAGYAFAIATSWAFAFVLHHRGNIRVDILLGYLPRTVVAVLDLLALISLLVLFGFMTWRVVAVVEGSLLFEARSRTPLETPVWIPQFIWLLGFGLFLFSIVPLIARVSIALVTGDFSTVRRLAGARSIDEEAQDEAAQPENGGALDLGGEVKKWS